MPELPEVETIRRELEALIIGKTFSFPLLHMPGTIAYPESESFSSSLDGRRIEKMGRRGKYLLIYLDRGILVVHLRMTGNLVYLEKGKAGDERFLRVSLPFKDGTALQYSDMRRFGRLWLVRDEKELKEKVLKNIGPDIFEEIDCSAFEKLLKDKSKRGLKSFLLDQSITSGMGNIYTDECLYRCGFHPLLQAGSLKDSGRKALYASVKAVLEEGIKEGGTSFRDYRNAAGALGEFQNKLNVYSRKGTTCLKCGSQVEKTKVAGRGTYYCPGCQPAPGKPKEKEEKC